MKKFLLKLSLLTIALTTVAATPFLTSEAQADDFSSREDAYQTLIIKFNNLNSISDLNKFIQVIQKYNVARFENTFGTGLTMSQSEAAIRRAFIEATSIKEKEGFVNAYQQLILKQEKLYNRNAKVDHQPESKEYRFSFSLFFPKTTNLNQVSSELTNIPSVSFVTKATAIEAHGLPNDSLIDNNHDSKFDIDPAKGIPYLWNLERVKADKAWNNHKTTGKNIIVAVLDDGIDFSSPDLRNMIYVNKGEIPGNGIDDDRNGYIDDVSGYNFYKEEADKILQRYSSTRQAHYSNSQSSDVDFHGTAVSSVIAAEANNNWGISGVAPGARILPVVVLSGQSAMRTSEYYQVGATLSMVAKGVRYATDAGADIINMSLGALSPDTNSKKLMLDAIAYATSRGVLVIASAGNHGTDQLTYPAAEPGVISVASTNANDQLSDFSAYGSTVDIAAPGEQVKAVVPAIITGLRGSIANPSYSFDKSIISYLNGTSFSGPTVAGAAALLMEKAPQAKASEIEHYLTSSTRPISNLGGKRVNSGILDIHQALNKIPTVQEAAHCTPSPNNLDINNDGFVSPIDVLQVVNYLNSKGAIRGANCIDVNGDGYISAMDALTIINYLNSKSR